MNRSDIRKAFKEIGYTVVFKRNAFKYDLCHLGFKTKEMIKPIVISSANCYSIETLKEHEKAFTLAESFSGTYLSDTEQTIR